MEKYDTGAQSDAMIIAILISPNRKYDQKRLEARADAIMEAIGADKAGPYSHRPVERTPCID